MSFLDGIINVGKDLFGGGTSNPIIDVGLKLGKEFFKTRGGSPEAGGGQRSFMQLPEIKDISGARLASLIGDRQYVDERTIARWRNKISGSKSWERLFSEAERASGQIVAATGSGRVGEKRPGRTGKTLPRITTS